MALLEAMTWIQEHPIFETEVPEATLGFYSEGLAEWQ
jgi:hypothetical protein